jgi:acyl-CoA synthetase (AMP-forming)/AMP-acid ligase II
MIKEFIETVPSAKFYVMYGQTEATARLSYLEPEYIFTKAGSIGKGIPGVELTVLNEKGEETAPGEVGEIVAWGRNIMMGYWNSPEETQQVLKNGALYTGDLAKRDDDGYIFIESRKKDIIKSGANRISPREIEDVVCQLPGVLECAAVGVPDEILGEAIKLFLVKMEDSPLTEQDILIFCRQSLALYKNPKKVELVPSLPKTASGKVKREELKVMSA